MEEMSSTWNDKRWTIEQACGQAEDSGRPSERSHRTARQHTIVIVGGGLFARSLLSSPR